MPKSFKLLDSKIIEGEKRWTYSLNTIFNYQKIIEVTITDHYQQKPGREDITNELILETLELKLNGKKVNPMPNSCLLWGRDVFLWNTIYQNKKYRLIFWFKDKETSHLWIRNCYPID